MSARILRRAIEDEPKIIFKHMEPLVIYSILKNVEKKTLTFKERALC